MTLPEGKQFTFDEGDNIARIVCEVLQRNVPEGVAVEVHFETKKP